MQDTAQLLIFLRGVNSNFEVSEELAALKSLKGTTTREDIFGKVCQTMGELDLGWSKLASITTDGTPSMVGALSGLIGRMNREVEERGLTPPVTSPLSDSQASTVLQSSEVGICHKGGGAMYKLHQSKQT